MIEVVEAIEIAASADTVWRVLTELDRYAEWNPFIRSARGTLEVGGKVRVRVRPSFDIPLVLHATVIERDARHLRWRGKFGAPVLGTGDHSFTIEPIGDRRVRLTQREEFAGLLPRLGARLLARETHRGFAAMNRALAERAERAQPAARRPVLVVSR